VQRGRGLNTHLLPDASASNNKREKQAANVKLNFLIGCRLPTPPLYIPEGLTMRTKIAALAVTFFLNTGLSAEIFVCSQTKSNFLKIQDFMFNTETLMMTKKMGNWTKKTYSSQFRKTSLSKNTYAILFTTWHYIKKREVVSGINYLTIENGKYKLIVESHANDNVTSNISYGICQKAI
jgi:hypothetical protein